MDIAIDCMGGDHGAHVTVPAALNFLSRHADVNVILVGAKEIIESELGRSLGDHRIRIRATTEVVAMDDPPGSALKNKKDSSMRVAVNLVKSGEAQACVSAGNTGALMAISRFVLKTLPGIDRPAIIATLPTLDGHVYMLDVGANVDSSADHLFQFALMGSVLVSSIENREAPSIGLLNVGEEDIKGSEVVKQTAELLRQSDLNFYGNVEGDDIFKGKVDIVVCDGFVGNIALKTTEGLAKLLAVFLREEFGRNFMSKTLGLLSLPVINAFKRRVDNRRYNGASFLGLNGIVIKSHGSADVFAFEFALERAFAEAKNGLLSSLGEKMKTTQKAAA